MKRRAISEILGVIILLAIIIGIFGVVSTCFLTRSNSQSANIIQQYQQGSNVGSQTVVSVQSDTLIVPVPGQAATWTIALKDSSSRPITSLTAALLSGSTTLASIALSPATVLPGQTVSGSISIPSGIIIGQSYVVTITAIFSDGSTNTNTTFVTATSPAGSVGSLTTVSVQSNKLVVALPGGSAVWTIILTDSSSRPITALTATLGSTTITPSYNGAPVSSNNQLLPGASASGSITISSGITLGQTYIVTIMATFSDGSSQAVTTSVTATSS